MRLRAELGFAAVLLFASPARAATIDTRDAAPSDRTYLRAWAATAVGMGIRFNNPYRLATPLGDNAESLSRTAPYGTLGVGAWFGRPRGLQHGPVLRYDRSLSGVPQNVITPSYGVFKRGAWIGGWSRVGFPILLSPDANLGAELAVGGAFYARAGIGITTEIIGDLFWGAATPDNKRPTYPVLSGQLGVVVEWERLP
jgi:hypothetical protein